MGDGHVGVERARPAEGVGRLAGRRAVEEDGAVEVRLVVPASTGGGGAGGHMLHHLHAPEREARLVAEGGEGQQLGEVRAREEERALGAALEEVAEACVCVSRVLFL